jgi:hypothetical protein
VTVNWLVSPTADRLALPVRVRLTTTGAGGGAGFGEGDKGGPSFLSSQAIPDRPRTPINRTHRAAERVMASFLSPVKARITGRNWQ